MRVFIIDTSNLATELQVGLVGVEGAPHPTAGEKRECLDIVSHCVMDGWAIAADPHTAIGLLAALTAEATWVPFVDLNRLTIEEFEPQSVRGGSGG